MVDADEPAAPPAQLSLAAGFPTATREQWATLVDGVLRKSGRLGVDAAPGAGVTALTRTTLDGIAVAPLYTAAPDAPVGVPGGLPFVRGATAAGHVTGWDVRQRHAGTDPVAVREAIFADLENGATSVWLSVGEGGIAPGFLATALEGVQLDLAPVVLDGGGAAEFLALAVAPATTRGTLGLDPVGQRARTGTGPEPADVVPLAIRVATEFPLLKAIVVDALPVHEAGGSDGQELGYSLAAGVAYLRVLTTAGLDVDTAARLLEFRYAATAEQFPTIAKFRAARRLWARVLEASGAGAPGQAQHAVASPTMLTRRDPYVNLLRGTVACFAAGVGGADAITVAPFDAAIGAATPFSRRIARNTQSLLIREAHVATVIDPAGGAWFVESLTDELARAGWAFFQELEAAGGITKALDTGLVAERTAAVREKREQGVATRRLPITGVSEFPDLAEEPVTRDPVPQPARGGLPYYRPAAAFEAYRDRADAAPNRPRAVLATLGAQAEHSARAGFARNLLQAGGIETVEVRIDTQSPGDAPAEGAPDTPIGPVAVLCSTDARYAADGAAAVAQLRAAGAKYVLVAGKVEVPGVDGQMYAGGDVLAVIDAVLEAQL